MIDWGIMGYQRETTTDSRRARFRALVGKAGALLLGTAMVVGVTAGIPAAAQAANPSAGFNPGNIISDAKFYDSAAMTSAQVQSFLNQRVPRCTIGDPGRAPWSKYGSTFIASVCLKDSRWTTSTRPANAYCRALVGKSKETAASYLVRVSKACGISQRVLLILLEKEQSLVTDTWPTARQYDRAMGHNCPDSGPNNSANCLGDGGFPSQVYRAAWQMKVYRAFPDSYNYKPSRSNTVQWHPNAGCGTSQVYIENWATAALYIYTPYRPNQAALNAGWGTGDNCSSYGNRNFYNYYTQWFGSTSGGYTVHAKLQTLYNANRSLTGQPTSKAVAVGGGVRQLFAKARMYWHPKTGASIVRKNVLKAYRADGEMASFLGAPIGVERNVEVTQNQRFQKGEIFWKKVTGPLQVRGSTYSYYKSFGGASKLGRPNGNQVGTKAGGVSQDFMKGSKYQVITWSSTAAPQLVSGDIRIRYLRDGGVKKLGPALAAAQKISGGTVQRFSKAEVYTTTSVSKTRTVQGEILKTFKAKGGAAKLGLPTSAQAAIPGGYRQIFEKTTITWTKSGGGKVVSLSAAAKMTEPADPDDPMQEEPAAEEVEPTPTPEVTEPPEPTVDPEAPDDSGTDTDGSGPLEPEPSREPEPSDGTGTPGMSPGSAPDLTPQE